MEIDQVRAFLEVARNLSFTEAADALNLTQPAVSVKIKTLEAELKTPLFYRLGRKIQLTEAGIFLYEEGHKLIDIENQLLANIEEIKKGKSGHLKIGYMSDLADEWLPEIIFKYRQQYPDTTIQCLVFESVELLYRALTSSQIDIGISNIDCAEFAEVSASAIATINYALIVALNHPLTKKSWLSLQDLKEEPWVLLPAGSSSRLVFESRLQELGLTLADFPLVEVVDNSALMRTFISQGNYLGFASSLEFRTECQSGRFTTIPLQEFALLNNIFVLLPRRLNQSANALRERQKMRHSSNPVQKFVALLKTQQAVQPKPASWRSPSLVLRSTPQRPETLNLSIGIQNSTITTVTAGLIIQRLRLLEHFLPKTGRYSSTQYQTRWRNYSTGAPIVQGLHSGELDIGILGDYPLLLSAVQQADTKETRLVSFVSINPDGSCNAVIVPNESKIQSIEDLRGRTIAVPFSSSAHGMVMRSLNFANILTEVKLAALENSDIAHPFGHPTVADGYAHFAPFHDIAYHQGKFRYLQANNTNVLPAFYGVVVSATLAEQHPEIAIAYLRALNAAQYWYASTPSALPLISQWSNLDSEIISRILSTSYHTNQSERFFSEVTIRPDWIERHIAQLSQIPSNESLKTIDLDRWIQPEFLQKVQS